MFFSSVAYIQWDHFCRAGILKCFCQPNSVHIKHLLEVLLRLIKFQSFNKTLSCSVLWCWLMVTWRACKQRKHISFSFFNCIWIICVFYSSMLFINSRNAKLSECLVSEMIIKTGPWHSMRKSSMCVQITHAELPVTSALTSSLKQTATLHDDEYMHHKSKMKPLWHYSGDDMCIFFSYLN